MASFIKYMIIKVNTTNQKWLAKNHGFVVFLSLDIENSTKYKNDYPNNWMFHFGHFFEKVRQYFTMVHPVSNSVIFKENGDEIIIAFFPLSIQDLKDIIDESIRSVETIPLFREILNNVNLDYKVTLFCAGYSEPCPFTVFNNYEVRSDLVPHN